MRIITREEFFSQKEYYLERIKAGDLFIAPTDTIYGIFCNALLREAVMRIRLVKNRPDNPFSIIVPSKEWITENCFISNMEWLNKLPGPYTLILPLKDKDIVAENISFKDTIGIRIPDHWFSKVIEEIGIPLVATSANKAGEEFMTSLEDLDEEIKAKMAFIIYEGPKENRPSTIIDLSTEEVKER